MLILKPTLFLIKSNLPCLCSCLKPCLFPFRLENTLWLSFTSETECGFFSILVTLTGSRCQRLDFGLRAVREETSWFPWVLIINNLLLRCRQKLTRAIYDEVTTQSFWDWCYVASVSVEACLSLKFKIVWTMILFLDPTFSYKHFCAIWPQ